MGPACQAEVFRILQAIQSMKVHEQRLKNRGNVSELWPERFLRALGWTLWHVNVSGVHVMK